MLWAMMYLCLFGFLQAGKAVAPDSNFDPSQHLTYTDIAVGLQRIFAPFGYSLRIRYPDRNFSIRI